VTRCLRTSDAGAWAMFVQGWRTRVERPETIDRLSPVGCSGSTGEPDAARGLARAPGGIGPMAGLDLADLASAGDNALQHL